MLSPIWSGPASGRGSKLRGMIEAILNAEEVQQPTAAAWSRLQGKLSKENQETTSYPAIMSADLPGLMTELAKDNSTVARAIRFATLTVTRVASTIGARWSEFDFKNNVWIIPGSRKGNRKAGVEHAVPLTAEMIACLPPREADSILFFLRCAAAIYQMPIPKMCYRLQTQRSQGTADHASRDAKHLHTMGGRARSLRQTNYRPMHGAQSQQG